MKKILILGGGLTGLSTAWKLSKSPGYNVEIIEIEDKLGGISSTFNYKGYALDYGPHKIYTLIPEIMDVIQELLKDDLLKVPKKCQIRLKGKYLDYPVGLKNILFGISPLTSLTCGLYAGKSIASNLIRNKNDITYEDYVTNRFGKGVYKLIFESYAKKVWGDPDSLSADLGKSRISMPNAAVMIKNMLLNKNDPSLSADHFYYPKKGMIMVSTALAKQIKSRKGKILTKADTKRIKLVNNRVNELVYKRKGKTFKLKVGTLVSTIPLDKLISLISPKPPARVIRAASNLKYRTIILLYIVTNKPKLFDGQAIFFPEEEFIFNRISEQKKFSEFMIPKNKNLLTVEITCDENSNLEKASKEEIFNKSIKDLEKTGIIEKQDVTDFFIVKLRNAYPVYDLSFKNNMDVVLRYLKEIKNLYTNGRQGLFNYNNLDHCIDMGIMLADHLLSNGSKDEWESKSKKFEAYRIIE